MAIKTTLAQLEEVQAAISKVMGGQDVVIAGNRMTRANLKELTERETLLLARYKSEQGTGGIHFSTGLMRRD
jgi:hypothetical protein